MPASHGSLLAKDLSIALQVGRETATPAPFAALCREIWAAAAALLGPGQDHTAMAKLSERLAGSALGKNQNGVDGERVMSASSTRQANAPSAAAEKPSI